MSTLYLITAIMLTHTKLAQEAAGEYKGFQALFGQPVDTLAALDALDAQAAERADVWRALQSLQTRVLDWTTGSVLAEDGTVRPRSHAQLHTCRCMPPGASHRLVQSVCIQITVCDARVI